MSAECSLSLSGADAHLVLQGNAREAIAGSGDIRELRPVPSCDAPSLGAAL